MIIGSGAGVVQTTQLNPQDGFALPLNLLNSVRV